MNTERIIFKDRTCKLLTCIKRNKALEPCLFSQDRSVLMTALFEQSLPYHVDFLL